ncbi:hypothetical protein BDU57DRAFT_515476 [Ampelomyces quisqualis]|uniref:Uncharacterized protein n=1 Tax=Ampelomyces quisqualis TaxID=50730 RepID=A0A6A5QMP9_AMPQU|nr:hypothetical protein BDU57DRAFT_515476 [Ampelomyces quisqualis]
MILTTCGRSKAGSTSLLPLNHSRRRNYSFLITGLMMNSNLPFLTSSRPPQDRTMSTTSRNLSLGGIMSPLAENSTQLPRDESFHDAVAQFQRELRQTETHFLLNLGEQHKAQLGNEHQSSTFAATIFSSHMETLCTLMGAKSCVLYFMACEGRDYGLLYNELLNEVHLHLFIKNPLSHYGFSLRTITNDVHIEAMHPAENWKGAWMLVDTRNKLYEVVEQEILKSHPCQFLAGRALGYPLPPMNVPFERRYVYIDKTATRELAALYGDVVDNLIGLDYIAPAGFEQEKELQEHFEEFRRIGRRFGREYVMGVGTIPIHLREGYSC